MEVDLRQSDEPFAGLSVLSFLPRTLGGAPLGELTLSSQAHEVEHIRCFLKSMAGESSNDVLEQGKAVEKNLQCGVRLPEKRKDMALDEGKQGRRPALGRERAQFSLKSVAPRDLIPDVPVSSQIGHVEDPEEFFLAFEQLENAQKELKKLRGDISTNPVQNDQEKTRKRRPGLLGKTASYKHHFSVTVPTDATTESCKASQELVPDSGSSLRTSNDILCCDTADHHLNTAGQRSNPTEIGDPADNKENAVNAILDNLLCSFKELDEGKEEALLRKSLHIKPIDVGKMHLPELHTVKAFDPKAANTRRKQNRISMCQLPQTSTSQARSSLAAISALYRRISLKGQSRDTYHLSPSNMEFDLIGMKDKHSISSCDLTNVPYDISSPDKLLTPHTGAEAIADGNAETAAELTDDAHCLEKSIKEQSGIFVDNITNVFDQLEKEGNDMHSDNAISKDSCPEVELQISSCEINMSTNFASTDQSISRNDVGASSCHDIDVHNVISNDFCPETEHPTSTREINMTENLTSTDCQCTADYSNLRSDDDASLIHVQNILQNEATLVTEDEPPADLNGSTDYSHPSTSLPPSTDGPSVDTSTLPRESCEVHRPHSSPQNKGRKHKPLKEQFKSKRQSLAGNGLTWQCGVRRSTRIRSRPLEFWRGERFLYGRIHDSLATVIGVKYSSPGQEGKSQALKVKSFVSDDYADLISQVAN